MNRKHYALIGMIVLATFFFAGCGNDNSTITMPNMAADNGATAEEMANQQCQNTTQIFLKVNNLEITNEDLETFAALFSGNTAYDDFLSAIPGMYGDDIEVLTPEVAAEIGEGYFEKVMTSWGRIKAMFKRS